MPEILSPAGGEEQARAAVLCGADAIYLGMKQFSARNGAVNFDEQQLRRTVSFCHQRGVKVYAAVNTMLFDLELAECAEVLKILCGAGVDGVISQDLTVIAIAEKCCPELELHASTQMTIHTKNGCMLAKKLGFSRVVLSRELPYEIIASLSGGDIETEVFVHGALCMSVSGQCLMSAVIGGRSANRGMCAQPCRLPCSVKKGKEDYALSLKDMSVLDDLPKLEKCGVDSFKIEGRMKRPEYAALTADCAVKALNGGEYDKKLLSDVFSRSGFTDGYLKGKRGSQMFGRRTAEDSKKANAAYPKIHELYRHERKRSTLDFFLTAKAGESIKLSAIDENGLYAECTLDEAENSSQPIEALAKKQLMRLGGTFYAFGSLTCDTDGKTAVSAAALNAARREICEKMSQEREEFYSKKCNFDINKISFEHTKRERKSAHKIRVLAQTAGQLERLSQDDFELAFLPLSLREIRLAAERLDVSKLGVCMPRFTFNEKNDIAILKEITALGVRDILCANLAHIEIANALGLTAHGGIGLNIANTEAANFAKRLNLADITVSVEMRAIQINALGGEVPIGVYAYGRLPLMLTANCPIAAQVGCKNCTGRVYDRTGRAFPIKCSKRFGYTELLNSDILCISDKQGDFGAADIFYIDLYDEKSERAVEIVRLFKDGKPLNYGGTVTRGLYFRR